MFLLGIVINNKGEFCGNFEIGNNGKDDYAYAYRGK